MRFDPSNLTVANRPMAGLTLQPRACNLGKRPSFSTLSYVWGDASITEDVVVDGVSFPVTTNLAAALRHTKYHWTRQFPERDPNEVSKLSFKAFIKLEWLEKYPLLHEDDADLPKLIYMKWWADWLVDDPRDHARCPGLTDLMNAHKLFRNRRWEATEALFELPYWKRVWIYQEAALSNTQLLCVDDLFMHYAKIEKIWSGLQGIKQSIRSGSLTRSSFLRSAVWEHLSGTIPIWESLERVEVGRLRVRDLAQEGSKDRLTGWRMTLLGRSYHATDPKDHIYGLLALKNIGITPDYRDYVRVWLQNFDPARTMRRLKFLGCSGQGPFENDLEIPSRTPNFPEASLKKFVDLFESSMDLCPKYAADSGISPERKRSPAIEGRYLVVEGVNVDEICRLGNKPQLEMWNDGTMLAYWIDFVSRHPAYKTGIPPLQAALRVIKRDISSSVNDGLVKYAHSLLKLLFPGPSSMSSEAVMTGLEKLGLKSGNAFNDVFPMCFFPEVEKNEKRLVVRPTKTTRIDRKTVLQWAKHLRHAGHGCDTPVLLRKDGDDMTCVGCCFILGLMTGEAKELIETQGLKTETLRIA
ncbi:hypothetical protein EK21DRAFT_87172 [Setomelanomma holmii]|uniref:Heterokaryon incompatibility domain-containing protein n=1 Tax=Setomelanomma holmii TaxID=210430 RepID=A0A9P4HGH4_9PLEO|nr:hypothetical protein EK21DRAFT_87172 [Setomelanomma holmii]